MGKTQNTAKYTKKQKILTCNDLMTITIKKKKGAYDLNSFMSWIGGKKALREEILSRFPIDYARYIEVFGGGGWVLFHKQPGKDFEVYNDFNPNLVNLYRCVRDHPQELCNELTYTLNSRLDFDSVKNIMVYGMVRRRNTFLQMQKQFNRVL